MRGVKIVECRDEEAMSDAEWIGRNGDDRVLKQVPSTDHPSDRSSLGVVTLQSPPITPPHGPCPTRRARMIPNMEGRLTRYHTS